MYMYILYLLREFFLNISQQNIINFKLALLSKFPSLFLSKTMSPFRHKLVKNGDNFHTDRTKDGSKKEITPANTICVMLA